MSIGPVISAAGRNTIVVALAGLALIAASASPSAAASAGTPATKVAVAGQAASDVTDFSAHRRRYYRRGPNAAGLAFMGVAAGLIGGAIAESRRREYYENRYYYGGYGPRYYGGPGYYGGSGYYYDPGYRYAPY
ncbi:hypothetical protein GA0061099_1010132 [Bradyrhizobium yuanmingense]|uniref:Transmembrane protein n=1 Tax=Bradyrhizobium yuanmingense TaxID=108015 RepID=A0A1C3X8Y8_9BRAD|nr:hypothetical protein [Bradyrhizobium yuanmingense]TWI21866.1 hypothetical protein IQ15_05731 [Bradyrhizobium yuanmingense]SCB48454.1 hypothetical protein GA0061099_1010132 [Bradyrhizobium yuanmingense]